MRRLYVERGTTLVEAVVAIGLLAGAVIVLAGLSAQAVRTAALARERSVAAMLALQKMEAMCRDVHTAALSPGSALESDAPGFFEYVNVRGEAAGEADGSVFVRRWAVTPMGAGADLLAVQVDVAPCRNAHGAGRCGDTTAHVRLASVRSRVAW
jgi:Tfp pilus assembly protein PilV